MQWLLLAASAVLIIVCGVFVAGEFALLTADRGDVERLAAGGDRPARGVLRAFERLSAELAGVQVAITLTNLAIGLFAEPAVSGLLCEPLRDAGLGDATEAVAVALSLVLSTVFTMVFGELVPKNLAIAAPVATARFVQGPVRAFSTIMRWPIRVFEGIANRVLGLFGLQPQDELASARSPVELTAVVRHSARRGTLATGTARLLVRTLDFGGKRARDVLTARPSVVAVDGEAPVARVLELVRETGHSRFPVVGSAGLDEVLGVAELDHAIAVPAALRATTPVAVIMRPALEVPDSLELTAVVGVLRAGGCQLAVVIDEYGGTAGLLTGEDVLEELVGEVDDEHDRTADRVRHVPGGFDVSALLRPDEVRQTTGVQLPTSGVYETLGGLVMDRLGRLPAVGDDVRVDGVRLTVTAMAGRRVARVTVRRAAEVVEPGEDR